MEQTIRSEDLQLPDSDNADIKRFISLFISNWYWFAFALFISLSLSYGINRYSTRIWTVSSSLLIKDDLIGGTTNTMGTIVPGGDIFKSQQNLKNEMGILRSFMLNYKVMKELRDFRVIYTSVGRRGIVESRMYKTCPFKVIYDSLDYQQTNTIVNVEILTDSTLKLSIDDNPKTLKTIKIGTHYVEKGFNFTIQPRIAGSSLFDQNGSTRYIIYFTDPAALADEYRSKLYVAPIEKESSLVNLSVSGLVPEQEADYLNKLMDVYITYGREYKTETATNTLNFIETQIKTISDSLKITENNMSKFRQDNSYYDPNGEGAHIRTKLEALGSSKAISELQLQYYNYLSEYLRSNNLTESIISPSVIGITDPVILRLVNDLAAIQKEKSKLSLNIEANQPAIGLLDQQTEEAKQALKESVRDGIEVLKLSINELDQKILLVEEDLKKLPVMEIDYIKVQRNFNINNTVYTYLLEKRAETGIAKASIVSDNRIIDNAAPWRVQLISPKTRKNNLFAIILGLLLPMVAIILIDYLNDKIIDKSDVEKNTRVPVIGYINHSDGKSEIPVIDKPGSSLAESFRSIRTSLKYFIKEDEKPVIAISSTISSEGKTFISINLAAIIAMLGKKILLIGLDLRKPRLNKVFEYEESPGMSNYLIGNCKYEDVIKETQIKNLYYAPSGPIPPNPSELLETDYLKEFMKKAKKEFDFIVIDTPPIAIVTDALLLTPYIDIHLFIVRQRYTTKSTLEIIEQLYSHGNMKHVAIIINDINLSGYYGYGMRYRYSLGYGYSYGYNYYGKGYYAKYGYSDKGKGYYTED